MRTNPFVSVDRAGIWCTPLRYRARGRNSVTKYIFGKTSRVYSRLFSPHALAVPPHASHIYTPNTGITTATARSVF